MRIQSAMPLIASLVLAACVPAPAGRTPAGTAAPSAPPTTVEPSTAAGTQPPGSSPSFVRPTPRPSPTFLVYEVRAGDTLLSIARQFGTTARSIAYWNRSAYPSLDPDSPMYEPGLIRIGWMLSLIPTTVVDEDELPDAPETDAPTASLTPTTSLNSTASSD